MAVKLRLMRMGKKKSPYYRVVAIDGRAARDSRYIELLGRYDPREDPSLVEIDNDKAVEWLKKGAQPTEAVAKLLEISGALSQFKVATGKIHTVAAKTPPPAAEATESEATEPPPEPDATPVTAAAPKGEATETPAEPDATPVTAAAAEGEAVADEAPDTGEEE